ncbi:MAG: von Willebrand factor type A domain-containing protein [Thermoanaerobaculia bacterium]|nr:von Willebrand factor type A domain-containing protein [Thermoanaerobaculia bacterium]
MKKLGPDQIEKRLAPRPAPPPPEGLAERIKEEIPEAAPRSVPSPPRRRQRWLIAATLFVAAGAAVLVYRAGREVALTPATALDGEEPAQAGSEATVERRQPAPGEPLAGSPAAADRRLRKEVEADTPTPIATTEPEPEAAERDDLLALGYVDAENRHVDAPATPAERQALADERRRLEATTGGAAGERGRKVPIPDPAPDVEESIVIAAPPRPNRAELAKPPARRLSESRAESAVVVEPRPAPAPPPPSTGGTAEPNDQPYGDVFFEGYGTNPFVDTEDDPLSTFGLDVDTGSYTVIRRYLSDGHLPPRDAVRVEEMINFFDYGDPAPRRGDFRVAAQAGPAPFAGGPRYRLVRFGVKAREIEDRDRRPATLIFVVDVSGSMNRENRLGLVQRSLLLLLDRLRSDDQVGLVVYGSAGQVLLEPTGDLEAIRAAIGRLAAGGSTNAEEGLALAYDVARRHFREGALHRLILCSDGVANVGRTGPDSILERIEREGRDGIELTTVGFGMGNYNDVLMEQLADRGNGRYAYVDGLAEARRIFVENLTGTLETVAADAKVQVEFDPAVVTRYRLLGYENRDVADERFRDDTVDAGEIGAGHGVTALYEVKLAEEVRRRDILATLRLRWRSVASGRVEETEHAIRVGEIAASWEQAPRELKLAAVVAELGEILKGSYWAREGDLDDLFARAQRLAAVEYEGDLAVAELAALVGRAARLR